MQNIHMILIKYFSFLISAKLVEVLFQNSIKFKGINAGKVQVNKVCCSYNQVTRVHMDSFNIPICIIKHWKWRLHIEVWESTDLLAIHQIYHGPQVSLHLKLTDAANVYLQQERLDASKMQGILMI